MKFFKDKSAVTVVSILIGFGTLAWISESFNVFTGVCYGLALFVFLARNYGK